MCVSTLSTTVITSNGGKIVRKLSVSDASPTSRSDRLLLQHEAGEPAQGERCVGLRLAARRHAAGTASPDQTCSRRSSSTAMPHSLAAVRGSLRMTTLCSAFTPINRSGAAVGEQQHHRPGVLEPHQLAPPQPHRSRPHAGVLQPSGERGSGRHVARRGSEETPAGSSSMPWNRAAAITACRRGWISSPPALLWRATPFLAARPHRRDWLQIPAPGSGCPSRKTARPMSPRAVPSVLSSRSSTQRAGHALQRGAHRCRFQRRRKRASSSFEVTDHAMPCRQVRAAGKAKRHP